MYDITVNRYQAVLKIKMLYDMISATSKELSQLNNTTLFRPSLPAVTLFRSPVEPLGLLLVLLGVAARHRRPARPLAPAALPPALAAAVPPPSVGKVVN